MSRHPERFSAGLASVGLVEVWINRPEARTTKEARGVTTVRLTGQSHGSYSRSIVPTVIGLPV